MEQVQFKVTGMQCVGCEQIITSAVNELQGIKEISADYSTAIIKVSFDSDQTTLKRIQEVIETSGYGIAQTERSGKSWWFKLLLALVSVIGLVVIMVAARKLSHQFTLPDLDSHLSDGMILIVGLITGLHCIGMCGGFVISYTARDTEQQRSSWLSHLLYGLGKTLSYAMFGAFFGFLGSMVSITPFIRGITNIAAGAFLILFGLNMLNVFSGLKRIRIKQPESMARFAIEHRKRSRRPFFIGFFSGFLLGCGPLQAMYVMAAGSSEPLLGAKILALFGLGTLPALLSFGFLTRLFSAAATQRFFQLSGVILVFVGTMMFNKGLVRTDSGYDFKSIGQKISTVLKNEK